MIIVFHFDNLVYAGDISFNFVRVHALLLYWWHLSIFIFEQIWASSHFSKVNTINRAWNVRRHYCSRYQPGQVNMIIKQPPSLIFSSLSFRHFWNKIYQCAAKWKCDLFDILKFWFSFMTSHFTDRHCDRYGTFDGLELKFLRINKQWCAVTTLSSVFMHY